MKPKPDPKRLQRATAQLTADHRPRQLQHEPRLSRADERDIVEAARDRNREATCSEVATALARMGGDLEFVKSQLGRVSPGDHRGYLRETEHGIQGLTRALPR